MIFWMEFLIFSLFVEFHILLEQTGLLIRNSYYRWSWQYHPSSINTQQYINHNRFLSHTAMTFMFYTVAFVYLLPCSLGASKVLDVFGIHVSVWKKFVISSLINFSKYRQVHMNICIYICTQDRIRTRSKAVVI